ncbi:hypothetical protein VNO80_16047 [Phaseolus coccineus]|uniref:Uncharacterized protein n=1 Tax=Phaseolus coccineus TaxID=3886 RepID=A0AAN9MMS7_PHACN
MLHEPLLESKISRFRCDNLHFHSFPVLLSFCVGALCCPFHYSVFTIVVGKGVFAGLQRKWCSDFHVEATAVEFCYCICCLMEAKKCIALARA